LKFAAAGEIHTKEREKLTTKLGRIGREWNMETWAWMFMRSRFETKEKETEKRSAMRMAAKFITVSLGRRDDDDEEDFGIDESEDKAEEHDDIENNVIDVC
jgi:hypothetical protein